MKQVQPTEKHLNEIKKRWGLKGEIHFLRRVENFVYEARLEGRPVILRVTEEKHRSVEELRAELDWMGFLVREGMSVVSPILSKSQMSVETLDGESLFHASVFEKAEGDSLKENSDFNPRVLKTWGEYLGRMHQLTRYYQRSPRIQKRAIWNEDIGFKENLQGLDDKDKIPYQRFHEFMEWLGELEVDLDCFGLVHADLHQGNFFVKQGEITAFDFDDCVYHWFAADLAAPLFDLLRLCEEGFFARSFEEMRDFYLEGYSGINSLEQKWLDRIDLFLIFRAITIYHWIKANRGQRFFNKEALDWCERILLWSRKKMEVKPRFV